VTYIFAAFNQIQMAAAAIARIMSQERRAGGVQYQTHWGESTCGNLCLEHCQLETFAVTRTNGLGDDVYAN